MTEYETITVKKRNATIYALLPERSTELELFVDEDDTRIARNGDARIARNGDTRISHNTASVHPEFVKVKKRNDTIYVEVTHG